MTSRSYRSVIILFVMACSIQAHARSALFESNDAQEPKPRRHNRVTIAGTTGFPGFGGVAGSYWPLRWLSLEAVAEYGVGLFVTAGPGFHLPLLSHGVHRHDLVAAARAGEIFWGNMLYPPRGFYCSGEAGYGYLGKNMDVRVLVGLNGTHDYRDNKVLWEIKPTLALRVGWVL